MSYLEDYKKIPVDKIREEIISQLKLNYAHGNIEVEEFEKRLDDANNAETKELLFSVAADLPALQEKIETGENEEKGVLLNYGDVKESDIIFAMLSGATRKGSWKPAKYTNIITFMGGVDLDFTEAMMPPGITEINVFCMMGGMDIYVPKGLNIEVTGIPIMGGFDNHTVGETSKEGPVLKIRALVIMGGIDIKEKKKKKKKKER